MKTRFPIISALLLGAVIAASCINEKQPTYTITADRSVIKDVVANNPGKESIVITTDAPYWVVTTPEWVEADPTTGVGDGNSTIVTLTIAANYKNESTDTNPRSGEIEA